MCISVYVHLSKTGKRVILNAKINAMATFTLVAYAL